MIISETLRKAMDEKDILAIRSSFYTIILSDPYFKTNKFDETLKYVQSLQIDGLFDEDDEKLLKAQNEWNEEYFDLLTSQLQDHFSKSRIEQLKTVAKYLASSKKEEKPIENRNSNSNTTTNAKVSDCPKKNENINANNSNTDKHKSSSTSFKTTDEKGSSGVVVCVAVALAGVWLLKKLFKGGK